MRRTTQLTRALAVVGLTLTLAACNADKPAASDDMKKALDQIAQTAKEAAQSAKDVAANTRASADDTKALAARIDRLEQTLSGALGKQKRGALYLALDEDVACDNDEACTNTARAVCAKINYPNGLTSKVNPGIRPTLHALVCYD